MALSATTATDFYQIYGINHEFGFDGILIIGFVVTTTNYLYHERCNHQLRAAA